MKNVRFIVDSTFGITDEYRDQENISIIQLNVIIDNKVYKDGDIPLYDIMDAVNEGKKVTTSQPAPGEFLKLFDKLFSEGAEQIIVFTISSILSGTINSATSARLLHPRKDDIFVQDSHAAHVEASMLLETAVRAWKNGKEGQEIVDVFMKNQQESGVLMSLANLNVLYKTGHLNKMSTIVGNIFHVKPIVAFWHDKVEVPAKVRSDIKVYEYFRDFLVEQCKVNEGKLRIRIDHVNAIGRAMELQKVLVKRFPGVEVEIGLEITAVLAINISYGGIGMGWIFEKE